MKAGFSATLAEKKLPRCQVGKDVYQYRGASSCRFLGGRLVYLRRRTCKSTHANDQWRRVIKCVWEPKVSNRGLFTGLKKVMMGNRVKVTAARHLGGAQKLLNSRMDRGNMYNDRTGKEGWIKVKFNSRFNLAGLGIKAGSYKANENPNSVHIVIKYGKNKKATLTRRPRWSSKRVAERGLWTGHLSSVYEI
jgi:hypothetical protein